MEAKALNHGLTPHGPGFSFIDSFEIVEPGRKIKALKWLDPQMVFFADHFPGEPIMPGVLLIETAAQTAGGLWTSIHGADKPRYALAQVEDFRLRRVVLPGQTLEIEAILEKDFGALAKFSASLVVTGNLVAQGKLTLSQNSV